MAGRDEEKAKEIETYTNDPIHTQQIYLDTELLGELYRKHGVKSWRYYQRAGEAVFIPAGCAHQVMQCFFSSMILLTKLIPS
jgi:hypothetical protein